MSKVTRLALEFNLPRDEILIKYIARRGWYVLSSGRQGEAFISSAIRDKILIKLSMASVKIVVIYPRPTDEAVFEREYRDVHMPMVESKMKGVTRFVATRVMHSPQGKIAAYRLAEVHFSSIEDLNKCIESEGGKQVVEHATKMSTGGPPLLLVCEEESFVFW